jgi:hypothetical protein
MHATFADEGEWRSASWNTKKQLKFQHYDGYFCSKTNQMHQCIKFILFGVTLYMFRTVFPAFIRSSRLYIQQPNRYCSLLASKQTAVSVWQMPVAVCTIFILERHSICFGRSFRPSLGVQDCTYSNRLMSNRYCRLLASGNEMELWKYIKMHGSMNVKFTGT